MLPTGYIHVNRVAEALFVQGARTLRAKLALNDLEHSLYCPKNSLNPKLNGTCNCGIDEILLGLADYEATDTNRTTTDT